MFQGRAGMRTLNLLVVVGTPVVACLSALLGAYVSTRLSDQKVDMTLQAHNDRITAIERSNERIGELEKKVERVIGILEQMQQQGMRNR